MTMLVYYHYLHARKRRFAPYLEGYSAWRNVTATLPDWSSIHRASGPPDKSEHPSLPMIRLSVWGAGKGGGKGSGEGAARIVSHTALCISTETLHPFSSPSVKGSSHLKRDGFDSSKKLLTGAGSSSFFPPFIPRTLPYRTNRMLT